LEMVVLRLFHRGFEVTAFVVLGEAARVHSLRGWVRLMAPVQGGSHRQLSGRPSGRDLREIELPFQPLLDLGNRQDTQLRGGQLYGERDSIQTPAQAGGR